MYVERPIFSPTHISSISSVLKLVFRASLRGFAHRHPANSSMPLIQTDPSQWIEGAKLLPLPFYAGSSRGPYFETPETYSRNPITQFATVEASFAEKAYMKKQSQKKALEVCASLEAPRVNRSLQEFMRQPHPAFLKAASSQAAFSEVAAPKLEKPPRKWTSP
jgi:hypothetical protein